jgi:hypothetical protein
MSEREVFIVKYLRELSNTDARQEVLKMPSARSQCTLLIREEFI